jgi:nitrite reductase/ring-hydroxylating ferredoxin subunit
MALGYTDVCGIEDLRPGRIEPVAAGRRRMAAVLHEGEVYVFQSGCPHRGAPLHRGAVRARLTGDCAGEMTLDESRPVVACPWHNYEYCLQTGAALWEPGLWMRLYATEVVDGRVLVSPRPLTAEEIDHRRGGRR